MRDIPCTSSMPVVLTGVHPAVQDDCACASDGSVLFDSKRHFSQNDCACAARSAQPAAVHNASRYQQAAGTLTHPLIDNYWVAHSPYAPHGPSVLNTPAWERWKQFTIPRSLSLAVDRVLAAQKLIVPQGMPDNPPPARSHMLTAWLHVTNACNLACPYCYVNKTPGHMSRETALRAIDALISQARKHGFRAVKLKYAGGEPTLNFDLLREIVPYARESTEAHGLSLEQVLLSNGTRLARSDALWLRDNNVRLMISLDGIADAHDRLRAYHNGKGSFVTVRRTIEDLLLPLGITPSLSLTITARNTGAIAATVRWALERALPISLNFFRLSSPANRDLRAEEDAIIEGMLNAYQVFEEILPTWPFFNGLLDRVQATPHQRTCGVASDYLVITHEGKVTPCHMLLDRPLADIGEENLLHRIQHGPIQNLPVMQKSTCRECEYRYLCSGGCPAETLLLTGREDRPHPNCRIYKTLLPKALRLEGLRLLKINGYLN